jgi:hypothetical protein
MPPPGGRRNLPLAAIEAWIARKGLKQTPWSYRAGAWRGRKILETVESR